MLRHPPSRRRGHTGGGGGGVLALAPAPDHTHLFASSGGDGAACLHDLRAPSTGPPAARLVLEEGGGEGGGGVAALAWDGTASLVAAAGRAVFRLDLRAAGDGPPSLTRPLLLLLHTAAEEVGGLACPAPGLVVVADDSGAVVTIAAPPTAVATSLPAHPSPAGSSRRPPARGGGALLPSPAHANLASCLVARPSCPAEILSGGFDCAIARWDLCGRRLVARWEAGACVAAAAGAGAAAAAASTTQLINPPFVHALAAGVGGGGGGAPPPRPLSGLVAAALGDGGVLLLDAEARPAGGAAPTAGGGGGPPRRGARAVRARPGGGGAAGAPGPPPRPQPPAGVLGLLAGLTRPATALAFSPHPSLPWLVSGGDDGRVLVWDWRAGVVGRAGRGGGVAGPDKWAGVLGGRGAPGAQPLLADVAHGRKVQALGVCGGGQGVVVVGDTGKGVWVYEGGE